MSPIKHGRYKWRVIACANCGREKLTKDAVARFDRRSNRNIVCGMFCSVACKMQFQWRDEKYQEFMASVTSRANTGRLLPHMLATAATCPHCGTTGNVPALKRWHFDRCWKVLGFRRRRLGRNNGSFLRTSDRNPLAEDYPIRVEDRETREDELLKRFRSGMR